jgi:Spy/CpxP family protein refolding chaperone
MRLHIRRTTKLAVRIGRLAALLLAIAVVGAPLPAQDESKRPETKDDSKPKPAKDKEEAQKKEEPKPASVKLGMSINEPKAFQGYTLIAPLESSKTYLLDMQGKQVRTWESDCAPALFPMLLENGHLLRPGSIGGDSRVFGPGPGVGGRIQEFTWEGELVWDFKFYNAKQLPHHDMTRLPNGNVLLIVSDRKTAQEAIAAGRRPEMTGDSHLIPDSLIEIKPTGKTTGEVVWEWHLWDHLVQDFDKTKANYGNVAEHPELVNVNYGEDDLKPNPTTKDGQDKPKPEEKPGANTPAPGPPRVNPDWTHFNGVAYNPDLDQIAVSVHAFSEFWIIDHGTSTTEAANHAGGRRGKGGDLLYRWGNPRAYRAGAKADQKLFSQHNAHWIPKGLPGAGHLLVFNNGGGRANGPYSSVDELVLPIDSQGGYTVKPGTAFGPDQPVWSYTAPKKSDFYSSFISGAQRLPNGNTLICSGANGTVFEVTPDKEIVWKYVNPVKGSSMGFGAPAVHGQIMSAITRDLLGVSADQRMQLDVIQKEIDPRFEKLLTADQRKQLAEKAQGSAPGGPGTPGQAGQIMASSDQIRLKLTDEQKKELSALQKEIDEKVDKVLTEAQKKQFRSTPAMGGPPQGGGPSQPGKILSLPQQDTLKLTPEQKKQLEMIQKGVDAMLDQMLTDEQRKQLKAMQGPVMVAGPGRGGPPGGTPLFRAFRYAASYPGFAGKDLTPGKTIEESQPKEPEKKEHEKKS